MVVTLIKWPGHFSLTKCGDIRKNIELVEPIIAL